MVKLIHQWQVKLIYWLTDNVEYLTSFFSPHFTMKIFSFSPLGYLVMTDDWFSEYVYEVVIHKKYLPAEILAILDQKPTVLPAWDPMGSLA